MYLTDSENKLTVDEINAFNAYFDHHLPASFLDFYLKNNELCFTLFIKKYICRCN